MKMPFYDHFCQMKNAKWLKFLIIYLLIDFFQDSLLPGLKIMIIGPVTCRRGVIFLEEANISIKGGEVDDLLIPNALENILANAL